MYPDAAAAAAPGAPPPPFDREWARRFVDVTGDMTATEPPEARRGTLWDLYRRAVTPPPAAAPPALPPPQQVHSLSAAP